MVQAFVLAAHPDGNGGQAWHVVALSFVLGVVNAFDIPTRQSFLSELVGKGDDLANAIALNSSVFNGARLVGPALAGMLLALTSSGVCFLVNGISYLAVLAALLAMRLPRRRHPPARAAARRRRRGPGLCLAVGADPLPAVADRSVQHGRHGRNDAAADHLHRSPARRCHDARAALGRGRPRGLCRSRLPGLAPKRHGLKMWIITAPVLFGLGMVAFSFVSTLWASALFLTLTGFALLLMTAGANTILQAIVEEDKRGRVLSLYTMAVTGLAPFGGLIAGFLADWLGATSTLRLAGLACLITWIVLVRGLLRWTANRDPRAVKVGRTTEAAQPPAIAGTKRTVLSGRTPSGQDQSSWCRAGRNLDCFSLADAKSQSTAARG